MSGVVEGHVVDVFARCEGTIFLLSSQTTQGREWLAEHLDPEAQRWDSAYVVEHRYVSDILNGALEDGLRIGGS